MNRTIEDVCRRAAALVVSALLACAMVPSAAFAQAAEAEASGDTAAAADADADGDGAQDVDAAVGGAADGAAAADVGAADDAAAADAAADGAEAEADAASTAGADATAAAATAEPTSVVDGSAVVSTAALVAQAASTAYTQYSVAYAGTGSYAAMGSTVNSMVSQYFGECVYVSDQLDDGTYNVVVYFGGTYNANIGDFTIYTDDTNTTAVATVAQSSCSEFYDDDAAIDAVYVINVESIAEPIYAALYVGGSMDMTITLSMTLGESTGVVVEVSSDVTSNSTAADDADDTDDDDATTTEDSESSGTGGSSAGGSGSSSSADASGLVVGCTYAVDVAYTGTGSYASLQSTLDSMVGGYFGYSVYVTPLSDGTYDVQVYFGGDKGYSSAVGDMTCNGTVVKQASDTTYTINVDSISSAIPLSLYVGGSMNMTVTYELTLDVSSATLVSGASSVDKSALKSLIKQAKAITKGSKTAKAYKALKTAIKAATKVYNNSSATQAQVSKAVAALSAAIDTFNNSSSASSATSSTVSEEGWQVGHTYEVPMTFLKENSSETSMSAQYFGDTAIVYVLSDGSLQVTFAATDEGVEQVTAITYNGSAIAQSGNQFTFTIPAAYADVAIPLGMTIKAMSLLGVGEQTTDLYLYLTQAVDLGTGLEGMSASSSNTTLAATGDGVHPLVVTLVGIAVAAAALCLMAQRARRRRAWQQPHPCVRAE